MLKTISAFERLGEENAFAVLARANALSASGRDVINLGIGQPDFRTPEHIVEAAVKALRDGHHGYTPATGIPALREAVAADLHKRFSVDVSPEAVMIMPGGKPTMFMSIIMFGEPGVDILYPDPGFPIYRSMIEYTGANPVPVPVREENGFAFSAEETLKLITPKTRLLILNSPANPTGGVTPKSEVDKLIAGLEKFPDVAIMSDEIYDHMTYDGEQHVCLLTYPSIRDRLILLNGWSKTYAMTGWRLGYAVWPGKLYDYARKLAVNLHSCVNAPTQYAGYCRAHRPAGRGRDHVRGIRQAAQGRGRGPEQIARRLLRDAEGRVLRFPNVKQTGWKAKALASSLLEDFGVAIIGGPDFGILGELIGCPTRTRPRTSSKALDRMGEFWRAARRREVAALRIADSCAVRVCCGVHTASSRKPICNIVARMARELSVAFVEQSKAAYVQLDGKSIILPQRLSGSGARYRKSGVTFWIKGNEAQLERPKNELDAVQDHVKALGCSRLHREPEIR